MANHGDQDYGSKGKTFVYIILTFLFIISVIVYVYYRNFQLEF